VRFCIYIRRSFVFLIQGISSLLLSTSGRWNWRGGNKTTGVTESWPGPRYFGNAFGPDTSNERRLWLFGGWGAKNELRNDMWSLALNPTDEIGAAEGCMQSSRWRCKSSEGCGKPAKMYSDHVPAPRRMAMGWTVSWSG
jgi:hypothetical protein